MKIFKVCFQPSDISAPPQKMAPAAEGILRLERQRNEKFCLSVMKELNIIGSLDERKHRNA